MRLLFPGLRNFGIALAACLVLLWPGHFAKADDATAEQQVDELFAQWNQADLPGCVVGIVQDGELIYSKGFGSAHLDFEAPNTTQTIFDLGSVAKSFTCACIALLADRGLISPDDEVRKYVPELHEHDTPIRIRHLIRCRSGVWAQWHIAQLAGWSSEPIQAPYGDDDLLTLLAGQKTLPFEPGTDFQYGTSDYFLLGLIVQRASGQSLAEFARENLFEPLGMKLTYYDQDPTFVVKNRAIGYYRNTRDAMPRWRGWTSNTSAAGGINLKSCVDDLVRWEQNFLENRLGGGPYFQTFLEQGTLLDNRNVLDANPTGEYRGLKRIQFTGGMPGFASTVTRFPQEKFAVICLANNDEIFPWKLAEKIADIYLADQLEPETPQATNAKERHAALSDDDLRALVGAYQTKDKRIWKVSLQDGKLEYTDHLNDTHLLHPLGGMRFRPEPYPENTFVFKRSDPDAPFELTLEYPGGSSQLQPVELVDPSTLKLDQYVGDYLSPELAITYHFMSKEGALWVRVGNRRWEQLDPTVRDQFMPHVRRHYDRRVFTFERDETNKVVGLNVALWRIKSVRFEKL